MTYYDFKKEKIEEICKKELYSLLPYCFLKEEEFNLKEYSKEKYHDFLDSVYSEDKKEEKDYTYQIMSILEKYNLENYGIAYLFFNKVIFNTLDKCTYIKHQLDPLGYYLYDSFKKIIDIEN